MPHPTAQHTPASQAAALAIRLQEAVRDLDAADKRYVAPYIADALVEAAVPDLPLAR